MKIIWINDLVWGLKKGVGIWLNPEKNSVVLSNQPQPKKQLLSSDDQAATKVKPN